MPGPLLQVIDEDALRGELAAESRDATSKQRSRHNTLPELKFEDVLPHTSSLNAHSQQAAAAK